MSTITMVPRLLLWLTLTTLTTAHGIPIRASRALNTSTQSTAAVSLAHCSNIPSSHAPTAPCFSKLDVPSYLTNYNLTSAELCAPTEIFSMCLLRAIYAVPGPNCSTSATSTSTCAKFDCVTLGSNACPKPQLAGQVGDTVIEAQAWYAAWNVYAVHAHVLVWATAINASTSRTAVAAAVDPRKPNTAAMVLTALMDKYGVAKDADAAVLDVVKLPTMVAQPAYGNSRVRGEQSTLNPTEWQALLVARLQDVLDLAEGNFTNFLGMVEEGAFSTRDLPSASEMVDALQNKSGTATTAVASTVTGRVSLVSRSATIQRSMKVTGTATAQMTTLEETSLPGALLRRPAGLETEP